MSSSLSSSSYSNGAGPPTNRAITIIEQPPVDADNNQITHNSSTDNEQEEIMAARNEEDNQNTVRSRMSNLLLYEEDGTNRLSLVTYLTSKTQEQQSQGSSESSSASSVVDIDVGLEDGKRPDSPTTPIRKSPIPKSPKKKVEKVRSAPKLGTIKGVFLPCFQNIIGIILFVRLSWIVGVAGIGQTAIIAFMGVICTLLTTLSLSAISTNGRVPSGGAYYMISRSLGPKWGGSVGVLFYLSNVVAAVLYVLGAIEIFTTHLVPSASLGSPQTDARVYGTIILFLLACVVMVGIGLVNKTAIFFLAAVFIAILASLIGLFASNRPGMIAGVTGFPGNFAENFGPGYDKPDIYGKLQNDVNIFDLFAIFFPSVTGIMAGSNRSGDLKDPARSIPTGTLAAQVTTSTLYFMFIGLLGTVIEGSLLRTKVPPNGLLVSSVAWPHPLVTTLGCLFASLGAGLQCFVGAPRLLQAIAKDDLVPFLAYFKRLSTPTKVRVPFGNKEVTILPGGEPRMALLLTFLIAEAVMLLGDLDIVAPIVTMLYLICYLFVNLSTALLGFLKEPNWRPSWRFYHWSVSSVAAIMCVVYMFLISWVFALISLTLMAILYKYIEYRGAQVHWGDGIQSFHLHVAQQNLMNIEKTQHKMEVKSMLEGNTASASSTSHVKNWRPQILAFMEFDETVKRLKFPKVLSFLSQMRKSGGLTIVTTVLKGDLTDRTNDGSIEATKQIIHKTLDFNKLNAFTDVVVAPDTVSGVSLGMQCSGLGVLRPNTVVLTYPSPSTLQSSSKADAFVNVVRNVIAYDKALLLIKNPHLFPGNNEIQGGTIDVYWICHDGGILTLLPHLIMKHRVWRRCKLRIFAVAELEDNSVAMKNALQISLKRLRIDAECEVLELGGYDVSEFAYEKTIRMQERHERLRKLGSNFLPPTTNGVVAVNGVVTTNNENAQGSANGNVIPNVQLPDIVSTFPPPQPITTTATTTNSIAASSSPPTLVASDPLPTTSTSNDTRKRSSSLKYLFDKPPKPTPPSNPEQPMSSVSTTTDQQQQFHTLPPPIPSAPSGVSLTPRKSISAKASEWVKQLRPSTHSINMQQTQSLPRHLPSSHSSTSMGGNASNPSAPTLQATTGTSTNPHPPPAMMQPSQSRLSIGSRRDLMVLMSTGSSSAVVGAAASASSETGLSHRKSIISRRFTKDEIAPPPTPPPLSTSHTNASITIGSKQNSLTVVTNSNLNSNMDDKEKDKVKLETVVVPPTPIVITENIDTSSSSSQQQLQQQQQQPQVTFSLPSQTSQSHQQLLPEQSGQFLQLPSSSQSSSTASTPRKPNKQKLDMMNTSIKLNSLMRLHSAPRVGSGSGSGENGNAGSPTSPTSPVSTYSSPIGPGSPMKQQPNAELNQDKQTVNNTQSQSHSNSHSHSHSQSTSSNNPFHLNSFTFSSALSTITNGLSSPLNAIDNITSASSPSHQTHHQSQQGGTRLIFCNLPAPASSQTSLDWIEYLEVLTSGLERVVLVKGSGMEVVTEFF